jgi:hypothetical protein
MIYFQQLANQIYEILAAPAENETQLDIRRDAAQCLASDLLPRIKEKIKEIAEIYDLNFLTPRIFLN